MGEKVKIREDDNASPVQKTPSNIDWASIVSPTAIRPQTGLGESMQALAGSMMSASEKYSNTKSARMEDQRKAEARASSANILKNSTQLLLAAENKVRAGENPYSVRNELTAVVGNMIGEYGQNLDPSAQIDLLKSALDIYDKTVDVKNKDDAGIQSLTTGFGTRNEFYTKMETDRALLESVVKEAGDKNKDLAAMAIGAKALMQSDKEEDRIQAVKETEKIQALFLERTAEQSARQKEADLLALEKTKLANVDKASERVWTTETLPRLNKKYFTVYSDSGTTFIDRFIEAANKQKMTPEDAKAEFNKIVLSDMQRGEASVLAGLNKTTDDFFKANKDTISIVEKYIEKSLDVTADKNEIERYKTETQLILQGAMTTTEAARVSLSKTVGEALSVEALAQQGIMALGGEKIPLYDLGVKLRAAITSTSEIESKFSRKEIEKVDVENIYRNVIDYSTNPRRVGTLSRQGAWIFGTAIKSLVEQNNPKAAPVYQQHLDRVLKAFPKDYQTSMKEEADRLAEMIKEIQTKEE